MAPNRPQTLIGLDVSVGSFATNFAESALPSTPDLGETSGYVSFVPNPDSKHARWCAFRRRTSGNCEVFHIVALPPSIACRIRLAGPIGQRLSAWIADATF